MGDLERIESKVDWLVDAVKHLLEAQVSGPGYYDDTDTWNPDPEPAALLRELTPLAEVEHVEPPPAPRPQVPADLCKTRGHNQQVYIQGQGIVCARCGENLSSSGVVQNRLTSGGQIALDPNPPQWATERSRGASSKNPGTPLVPHSVD